MVSLIRPLLILLICFSILELDSLQANAQTKNVPLEQDNFGKNLRLSILVISYEQIWSSTELGIALIKKLQDREEKLKVEADEVENYFIAEERRLTLERENLEPEQFLEMSNDFDRRTELERLNQRQKEKAIKQEFNRWRRKFHNKYMIPIIEKFMLGYGASIVIDIESQALKSVIFDSRINITDKVISEMNDSYSNIEELIAEITS